MIRLLSILLFLPAVAIADIDSRFFNILYENDIFYQEDGGYTNGIAINYARGFDQPFSKNNSPAFLLPIVKAFKMNQDADRVHGISYQGGQVMSTPEDIESAGLSPDQQPYAGLLIGRINFYALDHKRARRVGIVAGMVGPLSGAEKSQELIHTVTGSAEPQGWDNQLKNEPVFRLETSRVQKLWSTPIYQNMEFDISGYGELGAGNLASNTSVGLRWRIGGSLDDTYPIAMALPGREVNPTAGMGNAHWHIFTNIEARYEFNNILIEGNTFKESHGVKLKHEQARLGYGFSFNIKRWAFTYTGAFSTKTYETQNTREKFGSISVTYRLE